MGRQMVAWTWVRCALFRYAVIVVLSHGPRWLGEWLWRVTPVGFALRELFMRQGDYANAAECTRELQRLGEL